MESGLFSLSEGNGEFQIMQPLPSDVGRKWMAGRHGEIFTGKVNELYP